MGPAVIFPTLWPKVPNLNDARLGPEEHWRSIMKDDPMPKAITDFLDQSSSKKEAVAKSLDAKPNMKSSFDQSSSKKAAVTKSLDAKPNTKSSFLGEVLYPVKWNGKLN